MKGLPFNLEMARAWHEGRKITGAPYRVYHLLQNKGDTHARLVKS
jgi:hypothetical protein